MTPAVLRRPGAPLAALAVASLVLAACTSAGGGAGSPAPAASAPAASAPAGSAPAATASTATASGGTGSATCPTSEPDPLPAGETRTVTVKTDKGDFTIKVEADLSPIAAGNFVALAECGFYDGVVFHRAASFQDGTPFVIQGGDPTGTGTGGPGYTIKDEPVTATYGRGTVAMARTAQPDSVGSQFFVVLDDAARDVLASYNTYQIIGTVTDGMDTVDAIYAAAGGQEAPADPVAMTSVTVSTP